MDSETLWRVYCYSPYVIGFLVPMVMAIRGNGSKLEWGGCIGPVIFILFVAIAGFFGVALATEADLGVDVSRFEEPFRWVVGMGVGLVLGSYFAAGVAR